jgi:hypothetical protein
MTDDDNLHGIALDAVEECNRLRADSNYLGCRVEQLTAEVEALQVAARAVLDAIENVRIANQSDGAEGGSWISRPATRDHQARVQKAYADMHKAETDLRAALTKEKA